MDTKEAKGERVRKNTPRKKNREIDQKTIRNIEKYARSPELIGERIVELDKEWDIERLLEINMALIAIIGISLSLLVSPYSLILPSIALLFFLQHAIQGWCPPIPLFRYLKVRTRPEIDREKYALKAIRGDFSGIKPEPEDALLAFEAAEKIH